MSFEILDPTGKHAVVTGGASGIGAAIAQALAARGARVSVISRSEHSTQWFSAQADVADEGQVKRAFALARETNGPISLLVNNAGVARSAPLLRTSVELWDRILATNLRGAFLCTRAAVPDMFEAKCGSILNVASTAGLGGEAYLSAYCASKHGLVGFTRALAAEFSGSGVTANAICPGYTETRMLEQAIDNVAKFTGATREAARERLAQSNPQGRIATLEEVADAAIALLIGTRTGIAVVIPGGSEA